VRAIRREWCYQFS